MQTVTHFLALLIIAYTAYGYLELTAQIAFRLTNTNAPSTAQISKTITESISKKFGTDDASLDKMEKKAQGGSDRQREVKESENDSKEKFDNKESQINSASSVSSVDKGNK